MAELSVVQVFPHLLAVQVAGALAGSCIWKQHVPLGYRQSWSLVPPVLGVDVPELGTKLFSLSFLGQVLGTELNLWQFLVWALVVVAFVGLWNLWISLPFLNVLALGALFPLVKGISSLWILAFATKLR